MHVPIPAELAARISQSAVRHARERATGVGWSDRSLEALTPMTDNGLVGIKTTLKFLMYQERGTRPFVMWWVQGRRVPINGRIVTGSGPGTPGWVFIPGRGRIWRDQRWRHGGISPKNFMRDGLRQAIDEHRFAIRGATLRAALGPVRVR